MNKPIEAIVAIIIGIVAGYLVTTSQFLFFQDSFVIFVIILILALIVVCLKLWKELL